MCRVQKSFLDGTHYTKGLRRKTVLSDSENWAEARKASQAGQPSAREQSSELKVAIRERMSKWEREGESKKYREAPTGAEIAELLSDAQELSAGRAV